MTPPIEPPLRLGAAGAAVRDLQQRLAMVGVDPPPGDADGEFGPRTEASVRRFQAEHGLFEDGVCDTATWTALVEAGHQLGSRLLYLRQPMLRGDDVVELQQALGELGFDAGRIDGIFGPDSEHALREFQRNTGLTVDGICGRDTTAELVRIKSRVPEPVTVAGVRERERLRSAPRSLTGRRIVVAHTGGLEAWGEALGRDLHHTGARVAVLDHPDASVLASRANAFDADLVLGLELRPSADTTRLAYWATPGFESIGGRRLAELLADGLAAVTGPTQVQGMRLPLLRETRMPAVVVTVGDASGVVMHGVDLAHACRDAVTRWAEAPLPGG